MSVWVRCSSLSLCVGVVWVIEKWEGLFRGFTHLATSPPSQHTNEPSATAHTTKWLIPSRRSSSKFFAQHKVGDKINQYLLGLTPPIETVASFASLVGPDDELTTLLLDPAGISALEPPARTPAKANLRAATAQAKTTFAEARGPKETHAAPNTDDPDAVVDVGTKKNLFEKWSKARRKDGVRLPRTGIAVVSRNGTSPHFQPEDAGDVVKRKRLVTLGRAGKPEYSRP